LDLEVPPEMVAARVGPAQCGLDDVGGLTDGIEQAPIIVFAE
jgi:hypothetical protein